MNKPCNWKLTRPCIRVSICAAWIVLLPLLVALPAARPSTLLGAIAFSDIGVRATAGYQGDALGVTASAEGARLRCGFQKLEGHVTPEGLWLQSTTPGAIGRLRIVATALGRESGRARPCALLEPELLEQTDAGGYTALAATGTVYVQDEVVRFARPCLTEEYSVSVDGVRQDFVIPRRPMGMGDLRVELAMSGARAEAAACGLRLTLDNSERVLAYGRLRVKDATGRELMAHLEVISADLLAVTVADLNATYPVRIDPTFSDADWVSLNPGIPGADGPIFAIAADVSGNVYVGGDFTFIATVPANFIAKWDGHTWSALGSGMDNGVTSLAVMGTNLYVGGYSSTAGGVPISGIAKWDGHTWSSVGSGVGGVVSALAVIGTELYAGGGFAVPGVAGANCVAKWDGSTWSALGSGMGGVEYPYVYALGVSGTNLYAGGYFGTAGGVQASNIAKWDGRSWSALGSGVSQQTSGVGLCVNALVVSGGSVYAGGCFSTAGGVTANNIAKWDGSAWSGFGSGMNGSVSSVAVVGSELYAGGRFTTAGGAPADYIAKWDGSAWSGLGSGVSGPIAALAVIGPELYAGGKFSMAGGVPANNIAKWDGSTWSALGSGIGDVSSFVHALAAKGTDLYAGGTFATAGGVPANNIAKWDGSTWSALGSGVGDVSSFVHALAAIGTNLYAGGQFTNAGGVPVNYIAKWDGSAWSALGRGMGGDVGNVEALAVLGTNLYAGGFFKTAGGVSVNHIAKWNGRTWFPLGSGVDDKLHYPTVEALAVSGGYLYAGGTFTNAGGVPASCIAKWDGSAWSGLGSGLEGEGLALGMPGGVFALAVDGMGHLFAGGTFTVAGTKVSPFIAQANVGRIPAILKLAPTQTVEAGATVHLAVKATGDPPPAYHWYLNGNNLLSCTSSNLVMTNILSPQSGSYTVVIANDYGSVTSAPVMVNVIPEVQRRPVPGVRLTGASGSLLNVGYANALNPMPAWNVLGSVDLTSPPQYWFDTSEPLPPQRFYRAWQIGTPSVIPELLT